MKHPRWRPLTEGGALIVPLIVAGVIAAGVLPAIAPIPWMLAACVTFAFRDPDRAVQPQPDLALAPADGRVLHVLTVRDEFDQADVLEIAIFLSLLDVHVQRMPLDAVIVAQRHHAGGYRPAMTDAATHGNNQLATHLQTAAGPCTVTQISGIVARRIVTWAGEGDRLLQGERLGMIKFGSQVTLRLPVGATPLVAVGDRVRGGITPLARLTPAAEGS